MPEILSFHLELSQVLQRKVMSVYPLENGPCHKTVQILTIAFGSFQHKLPLTIQWMGPKKRKGKTWLPNHFVPINPETSGDDDDDANDDEKQTECSDCGGCDDDNVLIDDDDDDAYDVDAEVDDDYADYDNNEIDSDTGDDEDDDDDDDDDDDEEEEEEKEEETSKIGEDTEIHAKIVNLMT